MKKFPFAAGVLSLSLLVTAGCGNDKTTEEKTNTAGSKGILKLVGII